MIVIIVRPAKLIISQLQALWTWKHTKSLYCDRITETWLLNQQLRTGWTRWRVWWGVLVRAFSAPSLFQLTAPYILCLSVLFLSDTLHHKLPLSALPHRLFSASSWPEPTTNAALEPLSEPPSYSPSSAAALYGLLICA